MYNGTQGTLNAKSAIIKNEVTRQTYYEAQPCRTTIHVLMRVTLAHCCTPAVSVVPCWRNQ